MQKVQNTCSSPAGVLSSPYPLLRAPTSLSTAESENLNVGGPASSIGFLGARSRRKEKQKFLQKCFKSSEVKYSFGLQVLRTYHMPQSGVRRPKVKTKIHVVVKCNEENRW